MIKSSRVAGAASAKTGTGCLGNILMDGWMHIQAAADVQACGSGWGRPPSTSLVLTSFCCAALQVILSSSVFIPGLQLKQRCEDISHMARHLHVTVSQGFGGPGRSCIIAFAHFATPTSIVIFSLCSQQQLAAGSLYSLFIYRLQALQMCKSAHTWG
jgi:hypothetical protein